MSSFHSDSLARDRLYVRIREGWDGAGRLGLRLGEDISISGVIWTPVLWDDQRADGDPDFHKARGLEPAFDARTPVPRADGGAP